MTAEIINEIIIPATEGKALELLEGQTLRIYVIEVPQLGDVALINLHNFKEQFHVGQSWSLNQSLKTGNARSFKYFYSNPPTGNQVEEISSPVARLFLRATTFRPCARASVGQIGVPN